MRLPPPAPIVWTSIAEASTGRPCSSYSGCSEVSVPIPPGIESGQDIRITGEGEAGAPGAPPGDLYIRVKVKKHPLFVRDELNLHCQMPVTFSHSADGQG